jgi:TonB family protein
MSKTTRRSRWYGRDVVAGALVCIVVGACASGGVPSASPDPTATQSDCAQPFEWAYPDRTQLPLYYEEEEVDVRPERLSGPMPQYPEDLRSRGITGTVMLAFLILPNGRPDYLVVSRATHPGFVDPARAVILGSRYEPGEIDGRRVATLVCQQIGFSIRRIPTD